MDPIGTENILQNWVTRFAKNISIIFHLRFKFSSYSTYVRIAPGEQKTWTNYNMLWICDVTDISGTRAMTKFCCNKKQADILQIFLKVSLEGKEQKDNENKDKIDPQVLYWPDTLVIATLKIFKGTFLTQ